MQDISERQKELLRIIIEEYIETAEPVGSESIVNKYSLEVSPATVRNEMMILTELGYLKQPHTSAGRIPTSGALKFYINYLMRDTQLPVKDEVTIKEELWELKHEFNRLLRLATRQLSQRLGTLAVSTTEDGDIYYSGARYILDMPEFYDIDLTKTVLTMLDQQEMIFNLFDRAVGEEPIHILLGDELGQDYLEPIGLVFGHFGTGEKNAGSIGVLGPARMSYQRIIPTIRYFRDLLSEISRYR